MQGQVRWEPLWCCRAEPGAASVSADGERLCYGAGADVVVEGRGGCAAETVSGAGAGCVPLLNADASVLCSLRPSGGARIWSRQRGDWHERRAVRGSASVALETAVAAGWLPRDAPAPFSSALAVLAPDCRLALLTVGAEVRDGLAGYDERWCWPAPVSPARPVSITTSATGSRVAVSLSIRREPGKLQWTPGVWVLNPAGRRWRGIPGVLGPAVGLGASDGGGGKVVPLLAAAGRGCVQLFREASDGDWRPHRTVLTPSPAVSLGVSPSGGMSALVDRGSAAVVLEWDVSLQAASPAEQRGVLHLPPGSTWVAAARTAVAVAGSSVIVYGRREAPAYLDALVAAAGARGRLVQLLGGARETVAVSSVSRKMAGEPVAKRVAAAALRRLPLRRASSGMIRERVARGSVVLAADAAVVAQTAVRSWLARRHYASLPRDEIRAAGGRAEYELRLRERKMVATEVEREHRAVRLRVVDEERDARHHLCCLESLLAGDEFAVITAAQEAANVAALLSVLCAVASLPTPEVEVMPAQTRAAVQMVAIRLNRLEQHESTERAVMDREQQQQHRMFRAQHVREHDTLVVQLNTQTLTRDQLPGAPEAASLSGISSSASTRPASAPAALRRAGTDNPLVAEAMKKVESERAAAAAEAAAMLAAADAEEAASDEATLRSADRPSSAPVRTALGGYGEQEVEEQPVKLPLAPASRELEKIGTLCLGDLPERLVRDDPELDTVDLCWSIPGDAALRPLAEAFAENTKCTSLLLDDTPITDRGVLALAVALKTNRGLRHLSLRRTQLTGAGARMLLAALACNTSIRVIDVEGCDIDWTSRTALAAALAGRCGDASTPRRPPSAARAWLHSRASLRPRRPSCHTRAMKLLRKHIAPPLSGSILPVGEVWTADPPSDPTAFAAALASRARERRLARQAARSLVATDAFKAGGGPRPLSADDKAWLRKPGLGSRINARYY
eukprot:TRINITY_DN1648_c0_g3_i1.p1 TRINITY_DN1648_c0_g3~~TRINITY_DN1648_c0_g3_i1.p1  ORF type:complete len:980 (+),score=307.49 TRINITY_DN1648_c0_g3_i1:46-2940(+)